MSSRISNTFKPKILLMVLSNKRQMVCAIFLLGMNVGNYLRWHFFVCVAAAVAHVDTATIRTNGNRRGQWSCQINVGQIIQ